MYMHTLARFCESRRRFSLFSPLNIYISLFSFSPCSLPAAVLLLSPPLSRRKAIRASLLPPFLPSLRLSSAPAPAVCSVAAVCRLVCPLPPPHPRGLFRPAFCVFIPSGAPLKLSGGLPSCLLCLVVLWRWPLLVSHQAQNAMTVGTDAARICPRPCLLLPMCCRVFRCPFRVLSRGFRPSVRGLSCLLPCVVWWQ